MSVARVAGVGLLLLSTTGCLRGCPSSRPPIHINPSMFDQPKVLPQSESGFFYDGSSLRAPVPGTVARGELREDAAFYEGKAADGSFVAKSPVTSDDALRERGHDRYVIYCQPCHDPRGEGKGILFQRGKVPTANLNDPKYRSYPDGQIFDVVTNGFGLMPAYRWPIPPQDRWAIVAWVREMQARRLSATEAAAPAGTAAPPAKAPAAPGK